MRRTPYWNWSRLLGRVFDLDMATCPFCRRGSLRDCVGAGQLCCPSPRIIAAIFPSLRGRRELATFTEESVMTRILRHLKLASVPPPIAPARLRQEIFVFDEGPRQREPIGDVRAAAASFAPLSWKSRLKSSPSQLLKPAAVRPSLRKPVRLSPHPS